MKYRLMDPAQVLVIYEPRTSDWSSIRSEEIFGKTKPVTHWYLTVVIEHSAGQATYAYIMEPERNPVAPGGTWSAWAALRTTSDGRREDRGNRDVGGRGREGAATVSSTTFPVGCRCGSTGTVGG